MLGRSREEQNQRDLAALRAEVDRVGEDIRALAETLRSLGSRNLGPAAARLQDTAAAMAKTARRKLQGGTAAKPIYAAGAAFCLGAMLGFFLRGESGHDRE